MSFADSLNVYSSSFLNIFTVSIGLCMIQVLHCMACLGSIVAVSADHYMCLDPINKNY